MEQRVLDTVFAEMGSSNLDSLPALAAQDASSLRPPTPTRDSPPKDLFKRSSGNDVQSFMPPLPRQVPPDHTPFLQSPWFARAWLIGGLLITAFFLLKEIPSSPFRQRL